MPRLVDIHVPAGKNVDEPPAAVYIPVSASQRRSRSCSCPRHGAPGNHVDVVGRPRCTDLRLHHVDNAARLAACVAHEGRDNPGPRLLCQRLRPRSVATGLQVCVLCPAALSCWKNDCILSAARSLLTPAATTRSAPLLPRAESNWLPTVWMPCVLPRSILLPA